MPFFAPALMLAGGLLAAAALLVTVMTACRLWWCRRRRCGSVLMAGGLLALVLLLAAGHSHEAGIAEADRQQSRYDWMVDDFMTRHLTVFAEGLLVARQGEPVFGPDGSHLAYYADLVDYRDHGMTPRGQIPGIYAVGHTPARYVRVQVLDRVVKWRPMDGYFDLRVKALEFFDGLTHGGGSGVTRIDLDLSGIVTVGGHTSILTERLSRRPLWLASERGIDASEAVAWARAFQQTASLAASDPEAAGNALASLFHPFSVEPDDSKAPAEWHRRGTDHAGSVIGLLEDGALTLQPDGTHVEQTLPGGRSRIAIPVRSGIPRTLRAELIQVSGDWRCVRLAF